ncbi:MAG TPA: hypothetical protein VIM75_14465 [Ohtaekwangia sp.]|uniref:hypothetical protein n=1 Tax=Ohtaekwangia sp. TaxID=2066019 RepID=UPI002F942754
MKRNRLIQFILVFLTTTACAQNREACNRSVWTKEDAKYLPKEVCIKKGDYHITQVYKSVDLNGDGLNDFIFDWNKNPLQNGDTIFVTVYIQNRDSTFTHFRTFSNLYPIYFKSYDRDYTIKDKALAELHKKYQGENQLIELLFELSLIRLRIKYEAKEDLLIQYAYDETRKDWLLLKAELHDYALGKILSFNQSDRIGPEINKFNYFYWEE